MMNLIFDFPNDQATAQVALAAAEDAVKKLQALDPDNQFIEKLRSGIQDRRKRSRW
jgi:hypothetical protein